MRAYPSRSYAPGVQSVRLSANVCHRTAPHRFITARLRVQRRLWQQLLPLRYAPPAWRIFFAQHHNMYKGVFKHLPTHLEIIDPQACDDLCEGWSEQISP